MEAGRVEGIEGYLKGIYRHLYISFKQLGGPHHKTGRLDELRMVLSTLLSINNSISLFGDLGMELLLRNRKVAVCSQRHQPGWQLCCGHETGHLRDHITATK